MRSLLKVRHQYDIDQDNIEREATNIVPEGESLTVQGAPDADINELMRRMGVDDGSVLPASLGVVDPQYYGDFTAQPEDLREALDSVRRVDEVFATLPANIRARFDNDPWKLHRFINDETNTDEAIRLGLLHKTAAVDKTASSTDTDAPPKPE